MKTKIVIVSSWFPSPASPLNGIFVKDQAEVLAQDYDVAVLAPWFSGVNYFLNSRALRKSIEPPENVAVTKQSQIWPIPKFAPYNHYTFYRSLRRDFMTLLNEWGKPALIHAHVVLPAGWASVQIGNEFQIPVLLTEHSCPFSMHLKTRWDRRLVRHTLNKAARVLAVSPSLVNEIQTFFDSDNYKLLPNLIRDQLFRAKTGLAQFPNQFNFLCVAALEKRKGLRDLIQAAALLFDKGFLNFNVTICGSGSQERELKDMAQQLRLGQIVTFIPFQQRDRIRDLMQKCNAFVLPSYHETFGLVLAEAMACGKPVIATRSGGAEYVVSAECGILVDPSAPLQIANAIERILSGSIQFNPETIRQDVVQRFGERSFLKRIHQEYSEILGAVN